MGAQFQDLYKKGTAGWSVKFYKRRILSALTADLGTREEQGIPDEVCKKVIGALNASVDIVANLEDGTFITDDLHKSLAKFRDTYSNWNGVKVPLGRRVLHTKLVERRSEMFQKFQKQMDDLKKKDLEQWEKQHTLLSNGDKETMDRLTFTFNNVVVDHGGTIFPHLAQAFREFARENGQQ